MPYRPKGRIEKIARLNAIRKKAVLPERYSEAILLGQKGGITRKKIAQIFARWDANKAKASGEPTKRVMSTDNVLSVHKRGVEVSGMDAVSRLARRYLMKPLNSMHLTHVQKKIIERLVTSRSQKIPGTKINLRPPTAFLLIQLSNAFGQEGYQKLGVIFKKLRSRSKKLAQMAQRVDRDSDIFVNWQVRFDAHDLLLEISSPAQLAEDVASKIEARRKEIAHLLTMKNPESRKYAERLRLEVLQAEKDNIFFRAHHDIPQVRKHP